MRLYIIFIFMFIRCKYAVIYIYIYIDTDLAGAQRQDIWKEDSAVADGAGGRVKSELGSTTSGSTIGLRASAGADCRSAARFASPGVYNLPAVNDWPGINRARYINLFGGY